MTLTEIGTAIGAIEVALESATAKDRTIGLLRLRELQTEFAALHVELLERDAQLRARQVSSTN